MHSDDDVIPDVAKLYSDRDFTIKLIRVVIEALAVGPLDRYLVTLKIRERLKLGDLDRRDVDIADIAVYLYRRLAAAEVIRIDVQPADPSRLTKWNVETLTLLMPKVFFSSEMLAQAATDGPGVFRALEQMRDMRNASSEHESDVGGKVPYSHGETYSHPSVREEPELDFHGEAGANPSDENNANYIVREVFFATDRSPDKRLKYGPGRSATVRVGRCEVSIPRSHDIGKVERPWTIPVLRWQLRDENSAKHVIVQTVQELSSTDFYQALTDQDTDEGLVFVHGFNVQFLEAVRRTAQMAQDLQFKGAPILFSWPSAGRLEGYWSDEGTIVWSQPHLEAFLQDLARRTGIRTIHIIAHSLGNRAVATSLENIAKLEDGTRFRTVVLAAPDIDRGVFLQIAEALQSSADSVTLYASSNDRALAFARFLHNFARAGECDDPLVIPGITTIDVSLLDTDVLGHGYVSEDRNVLADIYHVLVGEEPPRFGLESVNTPEGRYWKFVGG